MRIEGRLEDISDGKLYEWSDMVKADTRGCEGCNACCHDMGDTIVLNPFDMYQLIIGTDMSYSQLIVDKVDFHNEDKIILPNLKMSGENYACGFLNDSGRCSVHHFRPSICRLFPLGRVYVDDDFKYIFKQGECVKTDLSKIKIKKWIDIKDYAKHKSFILNWHRFLKALKWRVKFVTNDQELKAINDYLIKTFYDVSWRKEQNFFEIYDALVVEAKDYFGLIL